MTDDKNRPFYREFKEYADNAGNDPQTSIVEDVDGIDPRRFSRKGLEEIFFEQARRIDPSFGLPMQRDDCTDLVLNDAGEYAPVAPGPFSRLLKKLFPG